MRTAAEIIFEHELDATPLAGTTAGLWDAMARATADVAATSGVQEAAVTAGLAHLAYLARLADPGERNDATGSVAPVVSLAERAAVNSMRRLSA